MYSIRQSLPVIVEGVDILVGLAPPNATVIEDASPRLVDFLAYASNPRSLADLTRKAEELRYTSDEADVLVHQLMEAGILTDFQVSSSDRFSRHDLFYDLAFGQPFRSQQLAEFTVGLVGVGGIGTNVAMQLSAAGIGGLVLMDADTVDLTNLTRQFLFDECDVGSLKVEAASKRLSLKNSSTKYIMIPRAADCVADLEEVFTKSDVVVISADHPQSIAGWANAASLKTGTPFTCAGYQDTRGLVGPLVVPYGSPCMVCAAKTDGLNQGSATSEDTLPSARNVNIHYQAPSYGPLNALVASFTVAEVTRLLALGESNIVGRRLVIDPLICSTDFEEYQRDPSCLACSGL